MNSPQNMIKSTLGQMFKISSRLVAKSLKDSPVRAKKSKTYTVPPGRVDEFITVFKHNLGHILAREMAKNCPVDTGELRESIRYMESNDGLKFLMAEHAWYVEYPTADHWIYPVNGPYLIFKDKNGDVVKAKRVHHPGTDAQPFVRPAFTRIQEFSDKAARMTLKNMGVVA